MNDPLLWQILLQVALIASNAIFACAEIAVISMNDNKLAQMAEQGDKRAVRLVNLTSQPARFLATIQVAITLSGFLGSAFAADNFSEMLVDWLVGLGVAIPVKTLDTIAVILITLILSYFTLVFGELVPKRIAMKKAEQLALGMSSLISFIARLFAPIVWALTASTNGILRLVGIDPEAQDEEVSEEEIRMMVDIGSQKGVIDAQEKNMIQNVFEFNDTQVGDFAIHRTNMDLLWLDESARKWEKIIHETRHTLYPVCGESVDDIIGILNVKDYFRLSDKSRDNIMEKAVKPPFFVPESICADVLFKQMKESKNHFAVVLDEYGGTLGIVTMNDLLEQLVGDLNDEAGALSLPGIEQLDDKRWRLRGSVPIDEVSKTLAVPLPVDDFDTFSGMVFGLYGSIPEDGSQLKLEAYSMKIDVTEIKDHCIESAIVALEA